MKLRILLTLAIACALCVWTLPTTQAAENELEIGSKAPPLDIEHWIQDGNGNFEHTTDLEAGKVYVLEFWATWCGPCIAAMPHLAEIQNQYRGEGVRVIAITYETVDEVNDLLAQKNQELGKTFEQITSAYSVAADPDESVHRAYMDASGRSGVFPTTYIVGKTGKIEWIGHPMELDQPLEAIVKGTWDREAYKKELKEQEQFEQNMQRIAMLAGAGKFDNALKLADQQLETVESEQLKKQWTAVKNSLKLSAGQLDEEVISFYRSEIKAMKGDAYAIGRFGYSLYDKIQQGAEVGPLASDALAAIDREVKDAEDDLKPLLFNTAALLNDALGNLDAAIEAQQAAIDSSSNPRQQERMGRFLTELQEKKAAK